METVSIKGTVKVRIVEEFQVSEGGSNRYTKSKEVTNANSMSSSKELTMDDTSSKTLTITKSGTLTIVPFSEARITGMHSQMKNIYVKNSTQIKLGLYRNSESNANETC